MVYWFKLLQILCGKGWEMKGERKEQMNTGTTERASLFEQRITNTSCQGAKLRWAKDTVWHPMP